VLTVLTSYPFSADNKGHNPIMHERIWSVQERN